MPSLFATVVAAAKRRLLNLRLLRGRSRSACFIERLTDDIVVDQILLYLDIEDILALRGVSLLFFTLTTEPVVWRRILRRLPSRHIPIPTLPPTPRYALSAIKPHEVEQLILRALSIDKNWRSPRPVVHSYLTSGFGVDGAKRTVLEIAPLSGGHYFVTCERRVDTAARKPAFSINVYGMDGERDRVTKLAMMQLQQGGDRAFNLHARYMTINGEKSLVVGWAIRDYLYSEHAALPRAEHPEDLPTGARSQFPMKTRFELWRVRLSTLERITDPSSPPRPPSSLPSTLGAPFLHLHSIYHRGWVIGSVCLDECLGRPLVALAIDPNIILIKDLNTGDELRWTCASVIVQPIAPINTTALLHPTYQLFPNPSLNPILGTANAAGMLSRQILRIRLLPTQETMIALRACEGGDKREPHYTMELYDFPKDWRPASGWRRGPPRVHASVQTDADKSSDAPSAHGAPALPPHPTTPDDPPLWPPIESASMNDGHFADFAVSDHGFTSLHDASLFPALSEGVRVPPISVFGKTCAPSIEGIMHLSIWPVEVPQQHSYPLHLQQPHQQPHQPQHQSLSHLSAAGPAPAPAYPLPTPHLRYTLLEARYQSYEAFENAGHHHTVHVLPGSYRALVYVTPAADLSAAPPVVALYSYVSPEARNLTGYGGGGGNPSGNANGGNGNGGWGTEDDNENENVDRDRRTAIRDRALVAIALPKRVSKLLLKGVTAIMWDESIGRLLFATVESSQVHVLDFAQYRRGDRYDLIPRKTSAEVRAMSY